MRSINNPATFNIYVKVVCILCPSYKLFICILAEDKAQKGHHNLCERWMHFKMKAFASDYKQYKLSNDLLKKLASNISNQEIVNVMLLR